MNGRKARIFLIAGEKGGTGKTTTAVNLAVAQALEPETDVLLVNADKQNSAAEWAAIRAREKITPHVTCVSILGPTLAEEIRRLEGKFTDIIIDAGGIDSIELRSGMLVADVLVTPARPSQFDVFTLAKMDNLVGEAQAFNTKLKAAVLCNCAPTHPNSTDAQDMADYVDELKNYTMLQTIVKQRKVYQNCARDGMGALEYVRGDEKAIAEMAALHKEIWA
jgi:chromosome partitioning protein